MLASSAAERCLDLSPVLGFSKNEMLMLRLACSLAARSSVAPVSKMPSRLKTARNYTEAIGQDLRIVGTEQTLDTSGWKPIIDLASEAGDEALSPPKRKPGEGK